MWKIFLSPEIEARPVNSKWRMVFVTNAQQFVVIEALKFVNIIFFCEKEIQKQYYLSLKKNTCYLT